MSGTHARSILAIVQQESKRLRGVTKEQASSSLLPEKIASATAAEAGSKGRRWSRSEVLGHLIDSALNNHQRFVRAQLTDALDFPGYSQNEWVSLQGYGEADWSELVTLWESLNRHIARVVDRIPAARLSISCRVDSGAPLTLDALVADYPRHMLHHLQQI